jgi:hypothetical protein
MFSELLAPLRSLAEYVDMMPWSIAFRESIFVSPYTTVSHVVAICFFAGLILVMDIRLLGWGFMSTPFSQLQKRLFPLQMLGMALAAITGLVLTFGDPLRFYANIFFWTKMLMIALTGINAMAFEFVTQETVPSWDTSPATPLGAKVAGGVSLFLWSTVIIAGRLIPYNWFA